MATSIRNILNFFLMALFLLPLLPKEGSEKLWQEKGRSILGDESKTMKLINAHLKEINKPFVKSIESPDGDIIDCVLIHLQPAFDHPKLRGKKPADPPKEHVNSRTKSRVKQVWSSNGESCPNGTIPIRRTSANDMLRFRSTSRFGKKISVKNNTNGPGHEHAVGYLRGQKYYGVKAIVNVWAPNVAHKDDFSLSQIWVISDIPNHDVNVIEAGWMVYPGLYGDNSPRLFIYWTNDGYKKCGCYNLLCSGFIQTNNQISIGGAITEVSTYTGSQFNIELAIYKDPESKDWWLSMDSQLIGYWPSALFSDLQDHATMISFGGEVFDSEASGQHTSTQMGSGHFPGEGFGNASFIKNIYLVDGQTTTTPKLSEIILGAEKPNCYDVTKGYNGIWDNYIFFGGPGSNPKCP